METCGHSFDGYVRQRRKTCCVGLPPPLMGGPIPIIERARLTVLPRVRDYESRPRLKQRAE